ncbi:MAG: hypothetical protein GEU90_02315 [Gemmatimonas sp.]|nr:hypothetical protein [Gemmatimonas sp.]
MHRTSRTRLPGIAPPLDPLSVLDGDWAKGGGRSQASPWPGIAETRMLARRGQRRLLMFETAVGTRLPDYGRRRRLRSRLTQIGLVDEGDVVTFTDSAHSSFFWVWTAPAAVGGHRYVDYRFPIRAESIRRDLRSLPHELALTDSARSSGLDPLQSCIVRRIASYIDRSRSDDGDPGTLLLAIAGTRDVRPLRRLWSGLERLTILDEACGTGDWLFSTGRILESIYIACVDRMRAWLDDLEVAGHCRRPEYLSDFRAIVRMAEDSRLHPTPEVFVRRLLLQRNLFGISSVGREIRISRRALLEFGRFGDGGIPAFDLNIVPSVARSAPMGPARDTSEGCGMRQKADDSEEFEVLARTLSLLRSYRLCGDGSREAFRLAAIELTRRRRIMTGDPPGSDPREVGDTGSFAGTSRGSLRNIFLRSIDLGGFDFVRPRIQ